MLTALTGCYGPTQAYDDFMGMRSSAMTEEQIEDWLEENYTHDMEIISVEEVSNQTYVYTIQDNDNGEWFYFVDQHDGVAGWTNGASYDEENPDSTREFNDKFK